MNKTFRRTLKVKMFIVVVLGLLTAGRFVLSLFLRLDGLRRTAAGQKVLRHPVILLEVAGGQGRSLIARFQLLHGLVEPDRRLCGCGPVGGVGGLVAGHPHRGAARRAAAG